MARGKIDRVFLFWVITLVVIGFFIFLSASLGLLAREGARFSSVAFSQIIFGIGGGGLALLLLSNVSYRWFRTYALPIFLVSFVITLLVFIPGIGFEYNGAVRWINIASFTFQPAELLKLGYVVYLAAWLSRPKNKLQQPGYGVVPFLLITGLTGVVLLLQPDTGTFLVIAAAGIGMFLVAGARLRDICIIGGIGVLGGALLALTRPYIMERLVAFLNPAIDPLGITYQIDQSLIAIGSGGIFGRGFGQSVQKFDYLPEPIGDSIFAVAAEEFGFIGSFLLIALFVAFTLQGLKIARSTPDRFGGLLVIGLVILITAQSFLNIGSMLGVFPLTGLPLLFVSHGGSALFLALAEIGIILSVSKSVT